ncbi:MAG TPA: PIN domain-containing protein [Thermoanaerobaculia bacterium]|jgi:predicted nucleic acid-binding protein|nr:PIN domain-containing protein [Thermoanaerobaculia bacterium]
MTGPNDDLVVYWDSCIFIAWLTGEQRPAGEQEGIRDCVRKLNKGLVTIVTSALVNTEVLIGNMPPEAQRKYSRVMRSIELVDLEPPIIKLAREIREYYQREKQAGRQKGVVAAADALHLATAINRTVDAFYTFDKGTKDKVSLLGLSGNVAGHSLKICKPPVSQLSLF